MHHMYEYDDVRGGVVWCHEAGAHAIGRYIKFDSIDRLRYIFGIETICDIILYDSPRVCIRVLTRRRV